MSRFRTVLAAALTAATIVASSSALAAPMAEKTALAKAVDILQGDPYGSTTAQVLANITERRVTTRRDSVCGGGAGAVWAFHVRVAKPSSNPDQPIDGWLVLDAASGKLVCATLPFLD